MKEILSSFSSLISKLYNSVENEGYELLEKLTYIKEDIFKLEPIKSVCSSEFNKYLLLIIITIIFGFLVYYLFKFILSCYSDTTIGIYHFLLKVIFIAIFSSNSYFVCKEVVKFNAALSTVISITLEEVNDCKIEFSFLKKSVSSVEEFLKIEDKLNIKGLIESSICAYIVGLIVLFAVRYVIIVLCIIIAPFSFLMLITDETKKIFYVWLKMFISNLLLESIIKFILFIPITLKANNNFSTAILIGSLILIYNVSKSIQKLGVICKE